MNKFQTAFDKLPKGSQDTMIAIGSSYGFTPERIKREYNEARGMVHGKSDPWRTNRR